MGNIKSLADQIREELKNPSAKNEKSETSVKKTKPKTVESDLLAALTAYDNSLNKSMVHARFDEKTVKLMNQFKMAANIDVTKLVAFSVKHFFETYPELKQIIKQYIQNTEL